jgi:lipid II:glycine glycyltransferase (peptidoglycan interpeptide bridge formation enzyme)
LRIGIRALRDECSIRQRLFLKVVPNLYAGPEHPAKQVFLEEGYSWHPRNEGTILIDLSPPLDELRGRLRRRWRQTLAKAEKSGLELEEGTSVALYDEALIVYRQMHQRKRFAEFVDKTQFRAMQESLPEEARMRILLVRKNRETVAALAWSVVGETGIPMLAATGEKALETNAAYLMWWKMVEWLKLNNFSYCDLGGIDPIQNPGGYTFKSGLGGDARLEVKPLGEFVHCTNLLSRGVVEGGVGIRQLVRQFRLWRERTPGR